MAELGIDCDLEPRAAYSYVTDDADLDQVREKLAATRVAAAYVTPGCRTGSPAPYRCPTRRSSTLAGT
ncbi:MAG: hypothetical protein ACRDTM_01595 [Micromonosporaceae bacterium]